MVNQHCLKMKKLIIILLAAIGITGAASAQTLFLAEAQAIGSQKEDYKPGVNTWLFADHAFKNSRWGAFGFGFLAGKSSWATMYGGPTFYPIKRDSSFLELGIGGGIETNTGTTVTDRYSAFGLYNRTGKKCTFSALVWGERGRGTGSYWYLINAMFQFKRFGYGLHGQLNSVWGPRVQLMAFKNHIMVYGAFGQNVERGGLGFQVGLRFTTH